MSNQTPTTETDGFAAVTGLVGFSSVLLAFFLILFRSNYASTSMLDLPLPIILTLCIALFLVCASFANDVIIKNTNVLLLLFLICGVLGSLSLFAGFLIKPLLPIVSIGIVAAILFWGSYLSTLSHQTMSFFCATSIVMTGIISVFSTNLPNEILTIVIVLLLFFAWICATSIQKELTSQIEPINRALSRQRSIPGKGNRYTLITVGFMLGVAEALVFNLEFNVVMNEYVLSIGMACAGLLILLFRKRFLSAFEDFAKRSLAAAITIILLPLPFVPAQGQAVLVGLFLAVTILNFALTTDAIAETARFNLISPIWLIGKEGALFLIGIAAGSLLFMEGFLINPFGQGLLIVCTISVILCNMLQIFIDNQAYPTLPESAEQADEEYDEEQSSGLFSARGGAVWRAKLNVIERQRSLSPRQKEIMELLVKGRDSRYIMTQFVISRSTAKTHIYNLYKKLGVHSRQELLDLVEKTEVDSAMVQKMESLKEATGTEQHG
jgi:DNA-binding CsgD family transcriptional regulator